MTRCRVEFTLDDDFVDPDHPSGMTEEANDKITDFILTMGSDLDVTVVK